MRAAARLLVFSGVAALLVSGCGGAAVSPPEPPAFDARVGTANYSATATPTTPFGTFLFYVFRLKNPAPPGGINVVVRGPAGWNNDQPVTLRNEWLEGRTGGWWSWFTSGTGTTGCDGVQTFECRAVSGRYTVEATVEGTLYRVAVDVDAGRFLPTTASISGTSTTSSVSVSWQAVPGAQAYEVLVRRSSDLMTVRSQPSLDTSATLTGLSLDAATQYVVDVRGFAINHWTNAPSLPDGQVNWSRRRSQPFLPGAAVSTGAVTGARDGVPAGEMEWGRLGR